MKVHELMTKKVIALKANEPLSRAPELMDSLGVRHLPVTDGAGDLVGLLSQRDLMRHSIEGQPEIPLSTQEAVLDQTKVGDVMIQSPECVEADTELTFAAQLMLEYKYGCVPVVEGQQLVGILTESDFVRLVAEDR